MTNRLLVPGVAWKLTPWVVSPGGVLKNVKLFFGARPSKVIVVRLVEDAVNAARSVNTWMTPAWAGAAASKKTRQATSNRLSFSKFSIVHTLLVVTSLFTMLARHPLGSCSCFHIFFR